MEQFYKTQVQIRRCKFTTQPAERLQLLRTCNLATLLRTVGLDFSHSLIQFTLRNRFWLNRFTSADHKALLEKAWSHLILNSTLHKVSIPQLHSAFQEPCSILQFTFQKYCYSPQKPTNYPDSVPPAYMTNSLFTRLNEAAVSHLKLKVMMLLAPTLEKTSDQQNLCFSLKSTKKHL